MTPVDSSKEELAHQLVDLNNEGDNWNIETINNLILAHKERWQLERAIEELSGTFLGNKSVSVDMIKGRIEGLESQLASLTKRKDT